MRPLVLVLLGFAWLTPIWAQEGPAVADREALEEIVRQDSIATRPDQPGVGRYIQDVIGAAFRWLSFRIERLAPGLAGWVVVIARAGAQLIFLLAVFLLVVLGFRWLRERYSRDQGPTAPAVVALSAAASEPGEGRSRQAWADDLRRFLSAGDVAAACEALWWWLAHGISHGPVESSWTSRELLAHARRRDLTPPVRRLDRMIYGAAPPTTDDVHRLWTELEEAVG